MADEVGGSTTQTETVLFRTKHHPVVENSGEQRDRVYPEAQGLPLGAFVCCSDTQVRSIPPFFTAG